MGNSNPESENPVHPVILSKFIEHEKDTGAREAGAT
jgi:hypothetical protein